MLEEQTKSRDAFQQPGWQESGYAGSVSTFTPGCPERRHGLAYWRIRNRQGTSPLEPFMPSVVEKTSPFLRHQPVRPSPKPFWKVNCSGHVKGSFTGAIRDKTGVFQAADWRHTFFWTRLGGHQPLAPTQTLAGSSGRRNTSGLVMSVKSKSMCAVLTATNRDLKTLLASGQMREDFYYRIRVFEIKLPPLRERREDLPLLVNHFIGEASRVQQRPIRRYCQGCDATPDAVWMAREYSRIKKCN